MKLSLKRTSVLLIVLVASVVSVFAGNPVLSVQSGMRRSTGGQGSGGYGGFMSADAGYRFNNWFSLVGGLEVEDEVFPGCRSGIAGVGLRFTPHSGELVFPVSLKGGAWIGGYGSNEFGFGAATVLDAGIGIRISEYSSLSIVAGLDYVHDFSKGSGTFGIRPVGLALSVSFPSEEERKRVEQEKMDFILIDRLVDLGVLNPEFLGWRLADAGIKLNSIPEFAVLAETRVNPELAYDNLDALESELFKKMSSKALAYLYSLEDEQRWDAGRKNFRFDIDVVSLLPHNEIDFQMDFHEVLLDGEGNVLFDGNCRYVLSGTDLSIITGDVSLK